MRRLVAAGGLAMTLAAAPALAQNSYCPERPGLDTPACITAPGRVSVETGVVDWTLDRQSDSRTDTVLIADTLVRVGVADQIEARIGWTPYGHERVRDRQTGAIDRVGQSGDVSLGMKAGLLHPDGDGLSLSLLPYVTLPVGGGTIGSRVAGGGLLVPVTFRLNDTVHLDATPEIDAQPDEERAGRHLRYSSAGGATVKLSKTVSAALEAQVIRDDDPDAHSTQWLSAASVTWKPKKDWQFDMQTTLGLNHAAPDVELAGGISRRF